MVGEIYAAREFRTTRDGQLVSLNSPTAWGQGEHLAVCHSAASMASSHAVPDEDCRCGFYAYTTADPAPDPTAIMGVVACYGTVLEGELGVRAEKARIVALHFGEAVPWRAHQEARNRYRDVEVYDDYSAMLDRFDIRPGDRRATKTGEGIVSPVRALPAIDADTQTCRAKASKRGASRRMGEVLKTLSGAETVGAELLSGVIRSLVMTAFLAFAIGLSIPQTTPYLLHGPWSESAPIVAAIAVVVFAPAPRWETVQHMLLQCLFVSAVAGVLVGVAQSVTAAGDRGFGITFAWLAVLFVAFLDRGLAARHLRPRSSVNIPTVRGSAVPMGSAPVGAIAIGAAGWGKTYSGWSGSSASSRPFRFALLPTQDQQRENSSA